MSCSASATKATLETTARCTTRPGMVGTKRVRTKPAATEMMPAKTRRLRGAPKAARPLVTLKVLPPDAVATRCVIRHRRRSVRRRIALKPARRDGDDARADTPSTRRAQGGASSRNLKGATARCGSDAMCHTPSSKERQASRRPEASQRCHAQERKRRAGCPSPRSPKRGGRSQRWPQAI